MNNAPRAKQCRTIRPIGLIRTALIALAALALMLVAAPTADAQHFGQFDPDPFTNEPVESVDWRNAFGRPSINMDFRFVGVDDVGFWGTVAMTNTGDRVLWFDDIDYVGGVGAGTSSCDARKYFVYEAGEAYYRLAPGEVMTCTMSAEHVQEGFNQVRANVSAWTDLGLLVSATDVVTYYVGPPFWWSFAGPGFGF